MAECLHCGEAFEPRKLGHVFCGSSCRHRGAREPHERAPADPAAIARLFDESRDPQERVRLDDWHPQPGSAYVRLELHDTVARRRRWYLRLRKEGRL